MVGLLDGQVAIVTGAGRGIGRAIAEGLAAEGCAVTVTARSASHLDATFASIQSAGGRALPDVWEQTLAVNLVGSPRFTRAVMPGMVSRRGGGP